MDGNHSRSRQARFALAVVAWAAVLLGSASPAHAWNPLAAAWKGIESAGHAVIGVIASPAKSYIEQVSQPTIDHVEAAGTQVIGTVNKDVNTTVDHVGTVTSNLVGQVNTSVGTQLAGIDHSLEARILQVKQGADDSIAKTFRQVNGLVDHIDGAVRARIAQLDATATKLVTQIETSIQSTLAQADQILAQHIAELHAIINDTITRADTAVQQRIEQLDQVAAQRIESVDVIATKQGLGFEEALLRIATFLGLVVFIGFAAWRLFTELGTSITKHWDRSPAHALGVFARRFFPQMALAGGAIALMLYLSRYLPRTAIERQTAQVAAHQKGFRDALAGLDLIDARFHETQLEILDSGNTATYRAGLARGRLLETVLTRPVKLQTLDGIKELMAQVAEVERNPDNAKDPDVIAVKAFMLWQVAATRDDEYEAAQLASQALDAHMARHADADGNKPPFILGGLMRSYAMTFLTEPYMTSEGSPMPDLTKIQAASATDANPVADGAFAPAIAFDVAVVALYADTDNAYLDMLDASATSDLARRTAAAQKVVDGWTKFDDALGSPALSGRNEVLAAFTLDDAVLTHALYFVVQPKATGLAPSLMSADPDAKPATATPTTTAKAPALSPALRIAIAPARVAWARRYESLLGRDGASIVAFEESQRFVAFEQRDAAFETAYVDYKHALAAHTANLPELAAAAATTAAAMGIYYRDSSGKRVRVSDRILAEAKAPANAATKQQIDAAYRARHIRFL